jgi:hypothetical protein
MQCNAAFILPQHPTTHQYQHWPCVEEGASARPKAHRRQHQVCLFLSCSLFSKRNLKQCKCCVSLAQTSHPPLPALYHHTCTQTRTHTNTNTHRLCISAAC